MEPCLKLRVLFLSETNGLHGPIAEALLRRIDTEHFEVLSAGISCGQLHSLTVEVMNEVGIELTQRVSRRAEDLTNREFDYVITLGESPARHHLKFQGAETIHWTFDDPVLGSNDTEKQLRELRKVRDQILQRLRLFVLVHVRSQITPQAATLSMAAESR